MDANKYYDLLNEIEKTEFTPTSEWIERLKPGSMAPDCFGIMRKIARVVHRGLDRHGKKWILVYLDRGFGSEMSHSYTVGERHITL